MSDPASCVPPDPSVSGWWWLAKEKEEDLMYWSEGEKGGIWEDFTSNGCWKPDEAYDYGYRILGPMPSHADVVEARGQIAQDGREIERLEAELTAANAEIARLKHEIASLRLTLGGTTFSADIPEPIGCPMPEMCAKVRALSVAQDEIARLKARAKATTIYLESVGGDFPDFKIATTNALLLLSGAVAKWS